MINKFGSIRLLNKNATTVASRQVKCEHIHDPRDSLVNQDLILWVVLIEDYKPIDKHHPQD